VKINLTYRNSHFGKSHIREDNFHLFRLDLTEGFGRSDHSPNTAHRMLECGQFPKDSPLAEISLKKPNCCIYHRMRTSYYKKNHSISLNHPSNQPKIEGRINIIFPLNKYLNIKYTQRILEKMNITARLAPKVYLR